MSDSLPRHLDLLFTTLVENTGHVVGEGLPDTMIRRVLACALETFPVRGAYLICGWDGQELVKYTARRGPLRQAPGLVEKRILRALTGLAARAHERREAVVAISPGAGPELCEECDLLPGVQADSLLILPLRVGHESVGVLGLVGKGEGLLSEDHRRLAQVLADQTGVGLRAAEKHREAQTLAREIERARRFGEVFSLVMLDMDNLKAYNDVHGHLGGSQVLRRVAQVAREQIRAMDVLAKYGGDEFVLVLPQTGREGANLVAERIRRAIEEHAFPGEELSGRITSSLGIASFPEDGRTVEELIDRADKALYRAKRLGRNRVSAGVEEDAAGDGEAGPGRTGEKPQREKQAAGRARGPEKVNHATR
jgi:diguanylate cyclase (GGDEF)-like protein